MDKHSNNEILENFSVSHGFGYIKSPVVRTRKGDLAGGEGRNGCAGQSGTVRQFLCLSIARLAIPPNDNDAGNKSREGTMIRGSGKFGLMSLALAAFMGVPNAIAAEACVTADSDSKASGTLASEDGAYILTIVAPICLKGEEDPDNVAATTRLHVFPGTEPIEGVMEKLVGKPVTVSGKLYGSRSAKHNAPILMEVSEAAGQ